MKNCDCPNKITSHIDIELDPYVKESLAKKIGRNSDFMTDSDFKNLINKCIKTWISRNFY